MFFCCQENQFICSQLVWQVWPVHTYRKFKKKKRKLTPQTLLKSLHMLLKNKTVHTATSYISSFVLLSCLILFLTVMELLSCLTLCSSCSRSSFSSELHFISFCFSSSLAEAKKNQRIQSNCWSCCWTVCICPSRCLREENSPLSPSL